DLVESLLAEPYLLTKLRESLKSIRDIERTTGRLSQGSGNARDLKSLQLSLEKIPDLKTDLSAVAETSGLHGQLLSQIQEFPDLVDLLKGA
ncbi:MAG: DNA mismatch repair protein MutS, partial [Akkermansiaceae bacterium]